MQDVAGSDTLTYIWSQYMIYNYSLMMFPTKFSRIFFITATMLFHYADPCNRPIGKQYSCCFELPWLCHKTIVPHIRIGVRTTHLCQIDYQSVIGGRGGGSELSCALTRWAAAFSVDDGRS